MVGDKVGAFQFRIGLASVDMAANHRRSAGRTARVLRHCQHAHFPTTRVQAAGEAVGRLPELPAAIETAGTARRLEVTFLPEVLVNVVNPAVASLTIKGELPRVEVAECPDLGLSMKVAAGDVFRYAIK